MEIRLDTFKPRGYQLPLCLAFENKGFKKILAIWPRRAGKDYTTFNLIFREALRNVGNYIYCLPTFKQARLVIWDSICNDGTRFLDIIPKKLIRSMNQSEMKIVLVNGSIIQLIGSDSFDRAIIGTNPRMVVLSEFALSDPNSLKYISPILNANDGTLIVNSTPRGRNELYELYEIATQNPDEWFCTKLTIDETKHISKDKIQKDIDSGLISLDMAQQEYYSSFSLGVEGAYYAKYIDRMHLEGRITKVTMDSSQPVHTAWDLGLSDTTVIIFFQIIGNNINIIDHYENKDEGLPHYIKLLKDKPYIYGKHIAPHDIEVREWASGGFTRLRLAKNLGINFIVAPRNSIEDGIEAVRTLFPRMWIDEKKCKNFIKSIESYRHEYDPKNKVYKDTPCHNFASNSADALRMLAVTYSKLNKGLSQEDMDDMYKQAILKRGSLNYSLNPNKY